MNGTFSYTPNGLQKIVPDWCKVELDIIQCRFLSFQIIAYTCKKSNTWQSNFKPCTWNLHVCKRTLYMSVNENTEWYLLFLKPLKHLNFTHNCLKNIVNPPCPLKKDHYCPSCTLLLYIRYWLYEVFYYFNISNQDCVPSWTVLCWLPFYAIYDKWLVVTVVLTRLVHESECSHAKSSEWLLLVVILPPSNNFLIWWSGQWYHPQANLHWATVGAGTDAL